MPCQTNSSNWDTAEPNRRRPEWVTHRGLDWWYVFSIELWKVEGSLLWQPASLMTPLSRYDFTTTPPPPHLSRRHNAICGRTETWKKEQTHLLRCRMGISVCNPCLILCSFLFPSSLFKNSWYKDRQSSSGPNEKEWHSPGLFVCTGISPEYLLFVCIFF